MRAEGAAGVAAAMALLLLAACDGGGGNAAAPAEAPKVDWKARIDALEPPLRDALFLRAIRDADLPCQDVIGSAYNGEQFGMPSWAARCRDGGDWLIMVGPNGVAQVARREEKSADAYQR